MIITRYKITYTALTNGVLPGQLGSMIRGVFGETLMRYHQDLYQKFFHPEIKLDEIIKKHTGNDLPAPFIIYPVKHYDFVRQNQEITFIFTLIGKYRQYENQIYNIFKEIQNTGLNHGALPVTNMQCEPMIHNHKKIIDFYDLKPPQQKISRITLQFKTPVSLNSKKQLITDFDFQRLFGYVYRRLFILDYLYDSRSIPENYPFELNKFNIVPVNIQLARQSIFRSPTRSEKYPMTGWKGNISYAGQLNAVVPYMQMGEFLHIGNKTVFGLGKYKLIF